VLCAVASPPFDRFQVCSAGHPPPIVASPGQPPRLLDISPDPPLGTPGRDQRGCRQVAFPPDSLLLLYTDGLIERRGEDLDTGFDRLRAAIPPGREPNLVCREVMRRLVQSTVPEDDIALVAVHRPTGESG
jgi:serine phosphatase RsbU (regulator of sigma subunit)